MTRFIIIAVVVHLASKGARVAQSLRCSSSLSQQAVRSVEHEVPVGLRGGLDHLRPGLHLPRPLPLEQQDRRRVHEEHCAGRISHCLYFLPRVRVDGKKVKNG